MLATFGCLAHIYVARSTIAITDMRTGAERPSFCSTEIFFFPVALRWFSGILLKRTAVTGIALPVLQPQQQNGDVVRAHAGVRSARQERGVVMRSRTADFIS
jgi:hypothetical protein